MNKLFDKPFASPVIRIGSFIIFIVILFNFLIPQTIFPRSVAMILLTLIPAIYLTTKSSFKNSNILFILVFLFILITSPNLGNLLNFYYLFLFQLLVNFHKYDLKFSITNKVILFIGAISIIIQIFYYSNTVSDEYFRTGLGTDPNFSGLLVLILFFYLRKANSKFAYIPAIIAIIFFQSRVLFLGVLVFAILEKLKTSKFLIKLLDKLAHPFLLIIASNLIVVMVSFVFIKNINFKKSEKTGFFQRVEQLNDLSNQGRLASNIFWISELLSGKYLLTGENVDDEQLNKSFSITPHNSLISLLVTSSVVFAILYLFYLSYLIKPLLNMNNYEYFYSYLSVSLFLHGLYSSIFLFPFLLLLLINNKNIRNYAPKRIYPTLSPR